MKVLLAYSGGLDTSYLVARLSRAGHQVTACTIDCGGWETGGLAEVAQRARHYGAHEHLVLDAKQTMVDRVLKHLIAGNVRRGQSYPLCVGAERGLQAELLANYATLHQFDALAHGCTGAGNDQIRFDAALHVVTPQLQVLAPIRDEAPAREAQLAFLREHGLSVPARAAQYSVNAGLWGVTLGGAELLREDGEFPDSAWYWTQPSMLAARSVEIEFVDGMPVKLDGQAFPCVELIEKLNQVAGASGVGRGFHLGDTVLGIKGRIAFEAPAAEVILTAHRELEKLVLTEDQRFWKDQLGEVYGRLLHQGRFHDPLLRDLESFFASSQTRVKGWVKIDLRGGQARVVAQRSPHSMMKASDAEYGERPASNSHPAAMQAVAQVLAEPAALHHRACAPNPSARAQALQT